MSICVVTLGALSSLDSPSDHVFPWNGLVRLTIGWGLLVTYDCTRQSTYCIVHRPWGDVSVVSKRRHGRHSSHLPQLACGNIGWTHAVCTLVVRAPSLHTKAEVAARVLDLRSVLAYLEFVLQVRVGAGAT